MRKLQRELTRAACKVLRLSPVQLSSKPFFRGLNLSKELSQLFSKENPDKNDNDDKNKKADPDKVSKLDIDWKKTLKIPDYEAYKYYFWVLGVLSLLFLGIYTSELIRIRSYEPINVD